MKRLLFPAFVAGVLGAGVVGVVGLVSLAGCDPDLGIVTTPGEAGPDGGTADGPVQQPAPEAGDTSEGGTAEGGGSEAGTEHVIDGTNDFTAGEKLATTSPGYDAYVSWDDKKIYFGMSGMAIGTALPSRWVLIYVDGTPGNAGSATGISYDCSGNCAAQAAHLPFNAGYHLRWKADGNYTNLQKYSGTAWTDVGPVSTFDRKGDFLEVSITRMLLGSPTKLKVHMNMLIESPGEEWTFAGAPSTSFTDGKSPASFAKYFEFDLANTSKTPSTYAPLP